MGAQIEFTRYLSMESSIQMDLLYYEKVYDRNRLRRIGERSLSSEGRYVKQKTFDKFRKYVTSDYRNANG